MGHRVTQQQFAYVTLKASGGEDAEKYLRSNRSETELGSKISCVRKSNNQEEGRGAAIIKGQKEPS